MSLKWRNYSNFVMFFDIVSVDKIAIVVPINCISEYRIDYLDQTLCVPLDKSAFIRSRY